MAETQSKQLLHLVFGGELADLNGHRVQGSRRSRYRRDLSRTSPAANAAWKAKAQGRVDNAHMRYFIVHLHRLLDPDPSASGPTLTSGGSMPSLKRITGTPAFVETAGTWPRVSSSLVRRTNMDIFEPARHL